MCNSKKGSIFLDLTAIPNDGEEANLQKKAKTESVHKTNVTRVSAAEVIANIEGFPDVVRASFFKRIGRCLGGLHLRFILWVNGQKGHLPRAPLNEGPHEK